MTLDNQPHVPVYRRLFERYRDDILNLKLEPGARVDSINEMMEKFQVGRETAKRVLNLLSEEGFIIQRRGKGSFVVDRRPRQEVWGLVHPFYSMQYEELIAEIAHAAAARGRKLVHYCTYNDFEEEIRLVSHMFQERYEAILIAPTMDESRSWNRYYSRLPVTDSSVVLLDHTMTCNDFRFVIQSYDLGVTRAVQYLMDKRDGAIAFVENAQWAGRNMVSEQMRATYLELIRLHRPGMEPYIITGAGTISVSEFQDRGVRGVFCCDDVSAIQVIGQLRDQGVDVPRDVHVVSYGNTALSRYFTPAITSVDPRYREMAEVLPGILGLNEGEEPLTRQHVVQPELVIRET